MEGDGVVIFELRIFLHFNPLPPHGGRLIAGIVFCKSGIISIHSLRMEGDLVLDTLSKSHWQISIHSLRMEGDPRK